MKYTDVIRRLPTKYEQEQLAEKKVRRKTRIAGCISVLALAVLLIG